ncbi:hypothetical protein A5872_002639, partial [Enterococcus faecium]
FLIHLITVILNIILNSVNSLSSNIVVFSNF